MSRSLQGHTVKLGQRSRSQWHFMKMTENISLNHQKHHNQSGKWANLVVFDFYYAVMSFLGGIWLWYFTIFGLMWASFHPTNLRILSYFHQFSTEHTVLSQPDFQYFIKKGPDQQGILNRTPTTSNRKERSACL